MIPLRDNVPRVTPPIMVGIIIGLNVLVFLYTHSLDRGGLTYLVHLFGVVPARFFEPEWAARAGYPDTLGWPFVTYMFLHSGWLHLILNMWMLWIFGDNIEDVTGHGQFMAFYLICGLAAVALHMVFDRASPIPIIGASGAIAGVMGAYVVLYPHGRVLTLIPVFIFPLILRIPAGVFLGIWFLTQIASGIIAHGQAASGVAWWAHVGGFAAGAALIHWFRRPGHCRYCYNRETRDYDPEEPASLS
ncbi:rhomboid family intramembrane serine protease [Pseudodesulfovibrio cashew]|uniref:Rhomboid family intramembrane serine protease n=1 Tax=Pseudodesulfovibrio cashew TaxID=2678688 RepID=A0A6I6JL45_9BACT|nr:rhomboid family intramembrane serine protease [Pseudodesulfovibrio cashew]QGY41698.1 rhomboid family intramembrane serine protease [Pseudodesulfovibrio cashew]